MRRDLFRREALDFNREKSLGDVVLVRPISFSLLTIFAVAFAVAVLVFAFSAEYTRKTHVSGYLAPDKGLIKVYAPQAGTWIEKHVKEGQQVKRGDTLFVLSTERSSRDSAETQAAAIGKLKQRRASLETELAKQGAIDDIQVQSTQERIRGMEAELAQLRGEMGIQQQRVASARENLARYRTLMKNQFVSAVQAQQKYEELLEQQARLQALMRTRTALERDINTLRHDVTSTDLRATNQRSAIERDIASLEQELMEYEARRTIVITAPGDGTVTAILAERGQTAQLQSALLSILPTGARLEAQLLVPSRAIGFIAAQQVVAVRYQAFPYQRFGSHRGRITEISRTLITGLDTQLPIAPQEPVYRVTVALDAQSVQAYNQKIELQPGMLLDADIWLDHRRIIDWVFDPLLSVTKKV
ncbi:MAG: HlyD family efflux transporter periplasmic adaptor subunit [Pseudomonadota bacterium]|nr:HlyD family efflux transporter periplasmic adaptor subunit [Pseudomonadota bacterium]